MDKVIEFKCGALISNPTQHAKVLALIKSVIAENPLLQLANDQNSDIYCHFICDGQVISIPFLVLENLIKSLSSIKQ